MKSPARGPVGFKDHAKRRSQCRSSYRLLLQSGRRCVGTSQDVIEGLHTKSRFNGSSTKFLEI